MASQPSLLMTGGHCHLLHRLRPYSRPCCVVEPRPLPPRTHGGWSAGLPGHRDCHQSPLELGTDKAEGSAPVALGAAAWPWPAGARSGWAGLGRSGPSGPSGCALLGSVCTGSTRAGRRGSGRRTRQTFAPWASAFVSGAISWGVAAILPSFQRDEDRLHER